MNLAEYRSELHDAHREYRETLQAAADTLEKRTMDAQMRFFGDDEKAVMVGEDTRPRYRDRD